MFSKKQIMIETYKGSPAKSRQLFLKDAEKKALKGYYPESEQYTPGSYGAGDFFKALILCLLVVGIFIFIFMIIVKPPGTLTVTYKLKELETLKETPTVTTEFEKVCPDCAESVKMAARKCRFCGYRFDQDVVVEKTSAIESEKPAKRFRL